MSGTKWVEAEAMLDRACRRERKSRQTYKCYRSWLRGYARWLKANAGPAGAATREERVSGYLESLSGHSAASQKQALNALVYFYRKGLGEPLGKLPPWVYSKRPKRLPTWITEGECLALFRHMTGQPRLMAELMFGSGLRLAEAVNLRVQDLDFAGLGVKVRGGKGDKDRVTCLPESLVPALREQVENCRDTWRQDRARGVAPVRLPDGLERKFPNGGKQFEWYWLFPAPSTCVWEGVLSRWHLHESTLGKALAVAREKAGIGKRVTAHTLRHSFATASVLAGMPVHELRELMGHQSIETTEVYLHCLPKVHCRTRSPLDIALQGEDGKVIAAEFRGAQDRQAAGGAGS